MSHEGRMRRGEISKDPNNEDRIYFLEQSKPVKPVKEEPKPEPKPKKKEKKKDGD